MSEDASGPGPTNETDHETDEPSGNDGPTPAIVHVDERPDGQTDAVGRETPEPTPQSEALRRQQLTVGAGVALLAGVAVFVAGIQQFPGFPFVVYLLFGMAATTLLFGLLLASMFASAAE
jgi:hypothetical protein